MGNGAGPWSASPVVSEAPLERAPLVCSGGKEPVIGVKGVSPRLPESKLSLLPGACVVSCQTPMRLGIFSDMHANYEALSAVLEAYRSERIDVYYCLGDTVGYGGSPNECADLVR